MTLTITRQPQGIPVGGQFAALTHSESSVRLDQKMSLGDALDLSTLAPGEARTISADVHGIEGIDTVTLTNKGPLRRPSMPLFIEPSAAYRSAENKNLIELRYTLPAEANIKELYEFDDWSYRRARQAAQSGLEEMEGLGATPWPAPPSHVPDTRVEIDENGDLSFTAYDTFSEGSSIDQEDLASWASGYASYSDPEIRSQLATRIQDNYNS